MEIPGNSRLSTKRRIIMYLSDPKITTSELV